jgi:drug/metabolite transporter (DMT)-like permease
MVPDVIIKVENSSVGARQYGLPLRRSVASTEWLPAERPFWAAVIRTLPAGLLLLPFALLTEAAPWPLSAEQLYGYGYLSLVGTLLTYALWFWGLRSLNTVAMSMVLISVLALQWIQSKPQPQSNSSNTSAAPTLKTKEDIL